MVMVRAISSFIAIAAIDLCWLDGWLTFRVQFALNPIDLLCRFVVFYLLRLARTDADEKRCSNQYPELMLPAV
jgi:hypothetical protein